MLMSSKKSLAEARQRKFYGRRQGRPLTDSRLEVLDRILPRISLPADQLTRRADTSPSQWFASSNNPIVMEIGFGNGEHLAEIIRRHPENNYIGAEPFINGMAAFLKEIESLSKGNIRVHMDDAMQIVHSLEDSSLSGMYVLNPDPWPKKRHHKRRIIGPENLDEFARVLKPGADLIMTTDVDDLAEWMLTHTFRHPAFKWTAETRSDWTKPPPRWIETRYEQKGRQQGRNQSYLLFKRIC